MVSCLEANTYGSILTGAAVRRRWLQIFVSGLSMRLDKFPIILPGSFNDALSGGPTCAEGCHERAVLAAQDCYFWVRLVKVVVELGKPVLFHPQLLLSRPRRERHQG